MKYMVFVAMFLASFVHADPKVGARVHFPMSNDNPGHELKYSALDSPVLQDNNGDLYYGWATVDRMAPAGFVRSEVMSSDTAIFPCRLVDDDGAQTVVEYWRAEYESTACFGALCNQSMLLVCGSDRSAVFDIIPDGEENALSTALADWTPYNAAVAPGAVGGREAVAIVSDEGEYSQVYQLVDELIPGKIYRFAADVYPVGPGSINGRLIYQAGEWSPGAGAAFADPDGDGWSRVTLSFVAQGPVGAVSLYASESSSFYFDPRSVYLW